MHHRHTSLSESRTPDSGTCASPDHALSRAKRLSYTVAAVLTVVAACTLMAAEVASAPSGPWRLPLTLVAAP